MVQSVLSAVLLNCSSDLSAKRIIVDREFQQKHPERSIGSGELQIDDSVEDIVVKETHMRESAKIGKRGHFNSSFLAAMELILNIPKSSAQKDV